MAYHDARRNRLTRRDHAASAKSPRGSTEPSRSREHYRVQVIDRAALILSCFDFERTELSVRDVATRTGLHKASAYRILMALQHNGFVEQDRHTGRYHLGLALFRLGEVAASRLTLRDTVLPFLRTLTEQTRETSHLAVLDGTDVLYVEKVEGPHALRMPSHVGRRIPAYCTALGKAMLSCMTDEQTRELLEPVTFAAFTSRTVGGVDTLLRDLAATRKRGWALDDEEIETGLRCIGAPVHDRAGRMVGAISIAAPSARLRTDRVSEFAAHVKATAAAVSSALGYGHGRPAGANAEPAADGPEVPPPPPGRGRRARKTTSQTGARR